jgi:hypothetical protein
VLVVVVLLIGVRAAGAAVRLDPSTLALRSGDFAAATVTSQKAVRPIDNPSPGVSVRGYERNFSGVRFGSASLAELQSVVTVISVVGTASAADAASARTLLSELCAGELDSEVSALKGLSPGARTLRRRSLGVGDESHEVVVAVKTGQVRQVFGLECIRAGSVVSFSRYDTYGPALTPRAGLALARLMASHIPA